MGRHCRRGALVFTILLAIPATAAAQVFKDVPSIGAIQDRVVLSFGFFLPSFNTDARIDSADGDGTGVDLEDDLGFKANDSVFRFDGLYRLSRRHQIGLSIFKLDRSSTKTIEDQIVWDDLIFDVGVDVRAHFNLDVYKLQYRYLALQGSRLAVGVGGGLNLMELDFGLRGQARIAGDGQEGNVERTWSTSPLIPVPSVGATVRWAILGNLFLGGSVDYLKGSYDRQEARYSDLLFSLHWFPFKNVGFGVMYDVVKITYQDNGNRFRGRFDYRYSGPVLSVNVIF
ncbi:MAG: hypothetical protein GXP47_14710 [Acidobacteria bacterium]|nr:hypothetical protein [Acidobacteriota bacterium]